MDILGIIGKTGVFQFRHCGLDPGPPALAQFRRIAGQARNDSDNAISIDSTNT